MREKMKNICRIDSLAKKILLAVIASYIVIVLAAGFAVPHLFYQYLKEEAVDRTVVKVESTSTRANMGFLLFINFVNADVMMNQLLEQDLLEEDNFKVRGAEITSALNKRSDFREAQRYTGLILTDDSNVYVSDNVKDYYVQVMEHEAYHKYLSGEKNSTFFVTDVNGENYIIFARRYEIEGQIYHLTSCIVWNKFFKGFEQMKKYGIKDYMLLYEVTGDFVWGSEDEKSTGIDREMLQQYVAENHVESHTEIETKDGYDFILPCSYEEGGERLVLFYHMSKAQLLADYQYIFWFVRIILAAAFFISAICIFVIINRRMRDIRNLSREMKKVEHGDYSVQVDIQTGDELQELGRTFNQMLATINDNIRRIVEQEKKEDEMRSTVLISEINPHFIYNTLSTINYLAVLKRNEDITKVTRALITILKDRLKIKEYQSFDSVKNEVELNNQYMEIQKYMHGDNVTLEWKIEEELLTSRIPKSIIQPLVENALLHGIYSKKDENGSIQDGKVTVGIRRDEDTVHICVADTGLGMKPEEIERFFGEISGPVEAGEHIGIRNIRMRLRYLYGDNYTMIAKSVYGERTEIIVSFPAETL